MSFSSIGSVFGRLGSAALISAAGYAYWYRPIDYTLPGKPRRELSPLRSRIDVLDVRYSPIFNLNSLRFIQYFYMVQSE